MSFRAEFIKEGYLQTGSRCYGMAVSTSYVIYSPGDMELKIFCSLAVEISRSYSGLIELSKIDHNSFKLDTVLDI